MGTFKEDQEKVARARRALEKSEQSFYSARLRVQKSRNPQSLEEVREELASAQQSFQTAQDELSGAIAALYRSHDFKKAAAAMDAAVPVLFLPLRLETRFVKKGRTTDLLVRIYPDDMHVHAHEPILTEQEVKYGKYYWISLATANRDAGEDVVEKKQKAWEDLSKRAGFQRAFWIVKQTRPENWTPQLSVPDPSVDLNFPPPGETKVHDWTRAPRTQVLPDKFAVSIIKGSRVVQMVTGNQVPDTVFLGPDPFRAEEAFTKNGNEITLDESIAWTTDFDQAEKLGLGIRISLNAQAFNRNKIDRVVVMGLLSSASPEEGQTMLEQLIENHQYSHKGFGFLPQMSATNNTESSESAYHRNDDYFPKGYYDGTPVLDPADMDNTAAPGFAGCLGIRSEILKDVKHAALTESFEASAMNKALYPATIGNFIEVIADPVVDKSAHPKVRSFFNSFVTASGPVPAVRVGDQPYGLLITSDLRNWKEDDAFHAGLTGALLKLQLKWDAMTNAKVSHTGKPGNPSERMLNILGLNAGSVSFSQRLGHLPDFWFTMPAITRMMSTFVHKQSAITGLLEELGFKRGTKGFPYISNLSFYDFLNGIPSNNLIDKKEPSETRFLDKLGGTDKNYIEWLMSVKKVSDLKATPPGGRIPRTILYLLLRHAILQELKRASETFYNKAKVSYKRVAFEKSLYNFNKQVNDISEWEILSGVPKKIDAAAFNVSVPIGDHFLQLRDNSEGSRNLKEMREAMQVLAGLPTSKLHKYLSDHIDLVSYRLDAWQTGLFYRRLLQQRSRVSSGIYIGAYGWVENLSISPQEKVTIPEPLRPADGSPVHKLSLNAGFVHTPSLNHATAAGVLLSGYQNHSTKSDPGPFAVNISSGRVRRALFILEGIQNNQPLEALLGYQFERALHDRTTADSTQNLNQYILAFREKFPVEHASIPQQGSQAQETVSPFSVVNGLKVMNAKESEINALVQNLAHAKLVLEEQDRLRDTVDALNDLFVSEAAFQATQGKMDRTAGLLNAVKNAEAPPELEFTRTPRSTHLSITNRVTVHFDRNAAQNAGPGWPAVSSPRSAMEPGLNQWLGQLIVRPDRIVCSVSHIDPEGTESAETKINLSELGLHPIDVVYLGGEDVMSGARELEYRIIRVYEDKVAVPPENRLHVKFEPSAPGTGMRTLASVLPLIRDLRLLVTTARPASAKDFESGTKELTTDADLLHGWQVDNLTSRVNDALSKLESLRSSLVTKEPNSSQPKDRNNPADFNQLFRFYAEEGASSAYLKQISFTNAAVDQILTFLHSACLFGIKVAYPEAFDRNNPGQVIALVETAAGILEMVNRKIDLAGKKIAEAAGVTGTNKIVDRLLVAAKRILGDDFIAIPLFNYTNQADIRDGLMPEQTGRLLAFINGKEGMTSEMTMETWMESVSCVRPQMRRLEQVRMISEVQANSEILFHPVQIPYQEKDSWLAVEFPEIDERTGEPFDPKNDTVCLAVHGEIAGKAGAMQSALVVDEWTEFVPNQKEVTGIAYNYDQPNATAPNALLLAVEPTGSKNWNWDILMGILDDTLRRAKSRAVEPAHLLEDVALDTLSPMTVASFDLHQTGVSLDYLVASDEFLSSIKNKNFAIYKDFKP
jgi:hypothetical protein